MPTSAPFPSSATPSIYRIKGPEEIASTLRERNAADRGMFSRPLQAALTAALLVAAAAKLWWLAMAIAVLLLADFARFVVRRVRTLQRWNAGMPRITSAADFAAADAAFEAAGKPSPTMSDYEQAMGFSERPDWRTASRYQEITPFYQGGIVADIGCGDGRLCWRYRICPPENYYGIDSAGLVKVLEERTGGRAHAIAGVAEATALPDNFVDLLVCTEVFEHLTEPGIALREFSRVVKPGGRVVIQSPSARRLRNFNPIHALTTFLGRWIPGVLLRTVVLENTFLHAYTYHWDFTRQDFAEYCRNLPLAIESMHTANYHFNPAGSLIHRLAYRISRAPIVNSIWWDLTVIMRKRG